MHLLGSLTAPFTLVRTELNGLIEYPPESWRVRKRHRIADANAGSKDGSDADATWYKAAPCRYYMKWWCAKGNDCTFQHGDADVATLTIKAFPCWYYTQGWCAKGDECTFKHEDVDVVAPAVKSSIQDTLSVHVRSDNVETL